MGRVCAAVNCTSRQKKDSGISFHEFPHKRPEVLTKWLRNVRREKWFPREKSSFLCSKHFLPDCFEGGRQTLRRLRDDAVPTVFDYTVKSRKRKLSSVARVKRLAASSSSVITSSAERIRPQKSKRKAIPQQRLRKSSVYLSADDATNKSDRHRRGDIENHSSPLRKSRLLYRRKYRRRQEDRGTDLNIDKKIRMSVEEENPRKRTVLRTSNSKNARISGDLNPSVTKSSSSASGFQTVTIVPTVASANGEVCYRLIVEDCAEDNGNADDSTKDEPSCSKLPTSATQRVPNNSESDDSFQMKCSFCKYVTQKRYLLSRHLKAHLERHPHQCDRCPFSFKTLLALQNHVNTHRGIRPFRCRRCDDQFTTSGELVTHMQSCDGRDVLLRSEVKGCNTPVPYFCPLCSFVGSDEWSLRQHLDVHSAKKLYECQVCDARFDNRKYLKVHKYTHLIKLVV